MANKQDVRLWSTEKLVRELSALRELRKKLPNTAVLTAIDIIETELDRRNLWI